MGKHILLFFFIAFGLWGQNLKIKGKVIDAETSTPLSFAKVVINNGKVVVGTDMKGEFEALVPKDKNIIIEISYVGYEPYKEVISEVQGEVLERTFKLKPEGTELEEVVVSASKFEQKLEEISISIETMKPKQVDIQASAEITASIQQLPGITVYKEQPSIRGSSGYTYGAGSRVITMLNGLPLISPDRQHALFYMLPTDNIKTIEVVKGASSVLYGTGAMGGVINVITDEPSSELKGSWRTRMIVYDAPGNKRADWDGRSAANDKSTHLFLSKKFFDRLGVAFQTDLISESGYIKEGFTKRFRTIGMFTYDFKKIQGLKFKLLGQYYDDSTGTVLAWRNYPDSALIAGRGMLSYQRVARLHIDPSISYTNANGNRHLLQARYFYLKNDVAGPQRGMSSLLYSEYQHIRRFGEKVKAIGGVNYTRNYVNADSVFGEAYSDQMAVFAQVEMKIGERLNVSLGARYQYEKITGEEIQDSFVPLPDGTKQLIATRLPAKSQVTMNEPIFRSGFTYKFTESTFMRASVGQALRSPSVAERFTATQAGAIIVLPNPDIKLERGYAGELGIKQLYKFGKIKGFIDLAAFAMNFTNMVEFYVDTNAIKQGVVAFTSQNVANAHITGIEFNFNSSGKFGRFGYYWTGGFTYTNPIDKNGNPEVEGDREEIIDSVGINFIRAVIGAPAQFPVDRPVTLKYRNKIMVRSSLELSYKKVSFTTLYRYNSHIINVDKLFLVDLGKYLPNISNRLFPGTYEFRKTHNKGWHEFDFILAFKPTEKDVISFHVFNAFNAEYTAIPGTLIPQRRFGLQYKKMF